LFRIGIQCFASQKSRSNNEPWQPDWQAWLQLGAMVGEGAATEGYGMIIM
jgi:hypothetical protein